MRYMLGLMLGYVLGRHPRSAEAPPAIEARGRGLPDRTRPGGAIDAAESIGIRMNYDALPRITTTFTAISLGFH